MNRLWSGFLAIVAVLVLASCNSGSVSLPDAYVRFVHVSPFTDAVVITADDNTLVPSLTYRGATPYLAVSSGTHTIGVASASAGTAYLSTSIQVFGTGYYTYYIFGGGASLNLATAIDGVGDAWSNYFNLRTINLATGFPLVDVYLLAPGTTVDTATPMVGGLTYGGKNSFTQFASGSYTLAVTPAGSKQVLYTSGALSFANNAKLTFVIYSAGSGQLANGALLQSYGAGTATLVDNPIGRFKFVAATTDVPVIDLLVDNNVVLGSMPNGYVSAYGPVTAGSRNFKIEASATPGAYIYDQNQVLPSAADRSLVAYSVQGTGSAGLLVLADNNLPPNTGFAKLRLVNASSDSTAYDVSLGTTPLVSGLAQGVASAYQQLAPGTAVIAVAPAGTTTQAASLSMSLQAGNIYTLYVFGRSGATQLVATTDF